ncbi:MAG TPA: GNAT family N-acetyltransferase [Planctomycetota bacterium]|nr:GNAT family N-acetyltransferase [Planctomycetota bacterium]HRR78622.1 GNAT family N-acetyltransferase [Planctomycetota bacterium]HRT95893.1 GNAT family N-acetyltransferase [Planctomycetota bacterium]
MIRPYRPTDRDDLLRVTKLAFDGVSIDQNIEALHGVINGVRWQERKASHVEADIAANPSGIFVCEAHGCVVGYVSCRINPTTAIGSIPNLAVHPAHQGGGIGRQLLDAALAYLRSQGMKYARIETLEQNQRCVALYPKLGFTEVARQIHYIRPL